MAKLILYNPVADLEVAPVLQLQLEVWRAGTTSAGPHWSILQLVQAWRDARPWEVRRWADSRGPLANAALSLKRIGWQACQTPLEVTDDYGATVSLLASSPALFKQVMVAAVTRQMERELAAKFGMEALEEHPQSGWPAAAPRVSMDAGAKLLRSSKWSPRQKGGP